MGLQGTFPDGRRVLQDPNAAASVGAPRRPSRVATLDGIRAVAICFVLFAHGTQSALADVAGSLGVSFFFVLSGFLITTLLLSELDRSGRIDLRAFYGRRTRRIFPAYYFFLCVVGVTTLFGVTHVDPRAFLYDVLYLRNYAFAVPPDWWTGHAWSLCVEEQFYLIWPALLVLGGIKLGWRFAIVAIVGAPMLRVIAYAVFPSIRGFIDVMLPTRIDMLMFGCALAIAMVKNAAFFAKLSPRTVSICALISGLILIFGIALSIRFRGAFGFSVGYTLTGIAAATLLYYVFTFPKTMLARFLSLGPVTWLGRISYSLYLWQQLFLTPGLNNSISGHFPFNLLAALALATVSYYLIERRFFAALPVKTISAA